MKQKQAVLPSHPHGAKLAQIFSYGWKWIEAPNESNIPNWTTNSKYVIRPRTLWKYWQDAGSIIGVRFDSSTCYAMLDIDAGSPYNNPEKLQEIGWALETIGIVRNIPIRSSWSGGLHLYIPLPQNFPTFGVACALAQCLECSGFTLAPGELECFPNVKTYARNWLGEFTEYNAHRLPLQPATGSIMLDADLEPIPNGDRLAIFLARWDNAVGANDMEMLAEAISVAKANRKRRHRQANGKVEQWRQDLLAIIADGWTGKGQTNQLLKEIACFGRVFEGLEGHDLADYIERTATNSPGFFEWSDHQLDIHRRAYQWAISATHYYWPLGTLPLRDRTKLPINEWRAASARHRIVEAVAKLGDAAKGKIREVAAQICKLAGCSQSTLYRNRDLWHPNALPPPTAPTQPPQASPPPQQCVTDQPEGVSGDMAAILAIIRESLKSTENQAVTHHPPQNEVCNLKSAPLKNLHSEGKEGGVGGEKGYPQAPPPPKPVENPSPGSGWLPNLNWKQGAVGDV